MPAQLTPKQRLSGLVVLPDRHSRKTMSRTALEDGRDALVQIVQDSHALAGVSPHRQLRGRLIAVVAVSVLLDLVVALGVHAFGNSDLRHCFVWTTSQLLTGGAGVSVTPFWTHYLELVLEVWAVTAIAALAGSFAAFFHRVQLTHEQALG
jgi:hypothetical protein